MKFLVVDDFSTMRRIIKNILKSIGYDDVDLAVDGHDALSKLKEKKYDMVLTDWNMPNMNGLELLRAIRLHKEMSEIPVIMVTAESKRAQIIEAAHAGVNGYIVKPFNSGKLLNKINAVKDRLTPPPQ